MPISLGTKEIELKLLPVTINPDGSALVFARKGWVEGNEFVVIGEISHMFTPEEVSQVLDTPPVAGLSRRDDLSLAIYQMMVNKGLATGTIS